MLRRRFSFCIAGLSTRDEILLKSLVRLLQNVTRHDWVYSPEGEDLAILGAEISEFSLVKGAQMQLPEAISRARLWVGIGHDERAFRVSLPLHFKDLEEMLNKVGDRLVALASAPVKPEVVDSEMEPNEVVQLLRWPPAVFLSTPVRAKTATLMLKAPIKISSLARRAGMPLEECLLFVGALPHVKRYQRPPDTFASSSFFGPSSQPFSESASSDSVLNSKNSGAKDSQLVNRGGIISRIRERLGLKR